MTSLKTSIKTITYLSDTGCLEIQGASLAFYIVKTQGVTIFNITQLLIPVSTAIFGYITLGEKVTIIQAISALIVIAGCIFATKQQ